jgi:predicted Zn-dependent protease with MMP-like domain
VIQVDPDEFDELVADALDAVPEGLADLIDNVVVLVEDEPPRGDPDLLGQYIGIPLTDRDSHYSGVLPDRIMLYRGPLGRMCASPDELVREVTVTVVHEIAHHFGIDEDRLHELGWG